METKTGIAKHLIVISYDAFSTDQWEQARKLPNLSRLIDNGAYTTNLTSVYPTLTYVVHATMVTGVYPEKHGVYHNNPFQPFAREKDQSWFWYRRDLKVPTVYDGLKNHHMTSAGILWPVTGKASITYNIPEIRAIGKENQAIKILKNGSPLYSIQMERKYGSIRRGIEQPYLDDFTTMCTIDTIRRKKPNLMLVHLIDLDDTKHESGTCGDEVEQTLIRMDRRLGDIMKAAMEAGIYDDTIFLVIGDHGQLDVRYKVKLNLLLKENGLLQDEKGERGWRAYLQSAGGAAYLHIKAGDLDAEKRAFTVLEAAMKNDSYGIERIYHADEMKEYHAYPCASYMLEAREGYCFDDGLEGSVITDLTEINKKYATHGYSPQKPNYTCNLVISGASVKKKYRISEARMVDIAPTIAKILGVEFGPCDGTALQEIFL